MTATGNEAVTIAQLRTATGSTGSGGATGGEAVTIAQAAQALGATPTGTPDVGGRAIRLSQLKTAVESFPADKPPQPNLHAHSAPEPRRGIPISPPPAPQAAQ